MKSPCTHVQECCVPYKEITHAQNPTTTTTTSSITTLPSPRATRAESTKRHVEDEGEERGAEEQEEEDERMKERRDGHKRQRNLPRLILISC